jgi:hypothetical protein
MSDAQSDVRQARLDAEGYLRERGWKETPVPKTRLILWKDPLDSDKEAMWCHEAVDLQRSREKLVQRVMES